MRKPFLFVFVWRWTIVLLVISLLFWVGVYFLTGNIPTVQYVFIEHYLMENILFTNISLYKLFLLDRIFPSVIPFVEYDQILVIRFPFTLPRWCDILLIPVLVPLISFIFKKEYYETNKVTNIDDDAENSFINELYRGRYSIYIILTFISLIYIVAGVILYPPQNADLATYTSDTRFWGEGAIQGVYIITGIMGGIVNGLFTGFHFSKVKPARTVPLSLLFIFCLSMLLAGMVEGILQGMITGIIITLSHFYVFVVTIILVFIFLFIKKIIISILNSSPIIALRKWLGIK